MEVAWPRFGSDPGFERKQDTLPLLRRAQRARGLTAVAISKFAKKNSTAAPVGVEIGKAASPKKATEPTTADAMM
jgi:hypothetical protein